MSPKITLDEKVLNDRAKFLADFIIILATKDSNDLIEAIEKGSFDPSDLKIKRITKETVGAESFRNDLIFFYFYLANIVLAQNLEPTQRARFMQIMFWFFLEKFNYQTQNLKDFYTKVLNEKMVLYDKFPLPSTGNTTKGTLLWEFGEEMNSRYWLGDPVLLLRTAMSSLALESLTKFNIEKLILSK